MVTFIIAVHDQLQLPCGRVIELPTHLLQTLLFNHTINIYHTLSTRIPNIIKQINTIANTDYIYLMTNGI